MLNQADVSSPASIKKITTTPTARTDWRRDQYGALQVDVGKGAVRTTLGRAWNASREVLRDLEAGDADEHRAPAWETGIDGDGKAYVAVNVSIFDVAIVDGQPLCVVQVRQTVKTRKAARRGWGPQLRKDWYFCGRNEGTGTPFAHAIEGRIVTRALGKKDLVSCVHSARPGQIVDAVRAWIWDCQPESMREILRHGDVAAIPVRSPPRGAAVLWSGLSGIRVVDAHYLVAEEARESGGRTYVRDFELVHSKFQHADVSGARGLWYRIQVGRRSSTWSFSRPTAD